MAGILKNHSFLTQIFPFHRFFLPLIRLKDFLGMEGKVYMLVVLCFCGAGRLL